MPWSARPPANSASRRLGERDASTSDGPAAELAQSDIERHMAARGEKVGPVALNRELSSLRATFNRAMKRKLINDNPFTKIEMVAVPEKPIKPIKPISDEEEQKLLEADP